MPHYSYNEECNLTYTIKVFITLRKTLPIVLNCTCFPPLYLRTETGFVHFCIFKHMMMDQVQKLNGA